MVEHDSRMLQQDPKRGNYLKVTELRETVRFDTFELYLQYMQQEYPVMKQGNISLGKACKRNI